MAAVLLGVVLGGLAGVVGRMQSMAVRDMRMVGGFFVISLLVVMGSFTVVRGCMFVVFGGFSMVFGGFVAHRMILFSWRKRGSADMARTCALIQRYYMRFRFILW